MAYGKKSRRSTSKRRPAARRSTTRSYSRSAPRRTSRVRRSSGRSAARPQTVRIELVQAPQPRDPNPIATALAASRKVVEPPKKAKF